MRHHVPAARPVRCAIYTRKRAANGIDDDLNSLEVQREICSAYIKSQRARGWVEIPERYDDGGFSGGNLNRSSLTTLLGAVEEGLVDVIVIYKLDRLTRSLSDFIRLQLRERLGFKRAAVAVARKLAVIMHSMLITGEPFRGVQATA